MRAAFVNDFHGTYGRDAVNAQAFRDKLARYRLQGLAFLPDDERGATVAELAAIRRLGITPWIYRNPHDYADAGPVELARLLAGDLWTSAPNGESLTLCPNIEYHDANYILACYLALRDHVGARHRIVWVLEPGQGGWFTKDLVGAIAADPLFLVAPEQYFGNGESWGTVDRVRADITGRGVPVAQVKITVRGGLVTPATFPDGIAFTLDEGAPWGLP